jgi:cobalt-zinc-cadmium resistance protein CzcA
MSLTIKFKLLLTLSTQDIEQYITYPVEIEMANLPGVKEIRSISKFGLSVVTIVLKMI